MGEQERRAASRAVAAWVAELPAAKREAFLDACEHTQSVVELWLYAGVLDFPLPFESLQAYAEEKFPKVSRRAILAAEVEQLQGDLAELRLARERLEVKPDVAVQRITQLTKELRAHLKAIDDITRAIERRGLLLAGADRLARDLMRTFQKDERIREPLEAAIDAAWLEIAGEA